MEKWNLPLDPPPAYLDPAREVTAQNDDPHPPADVFFPRCVDTLLAHPKGLTFYQAISAAANTFVEVGRKLSYRAWCLGGWKVTHALVENYERVHGVKPRWWRAPGNKAPGATRTDLKGGDPPTCFYMGFASMDEYFDAWLRRFVPKPGVDIPPPPARGEDPYGRYRHTGELFWSNRDWYEALCRAGYKGANTERDPGPTVRELQALVGEVAEWWAQSRLRQTLPTDAQKTFPVDGVWGPRSIALCREFQAQQGLPLTGVVHQASELDLATLTALQRATRPV